MYLVYLLLIFPVGTFSTANTPMQPTACGAQDPSFFTVFASRLGDN
jgi:hypothetical protein